jgi:ribosomal protein L40E
VSDGAHWSRAGCRVIPLKYDTSFSCSMLEVHCAPVSWQTEPGPITYHQCTVDGAAINGCRSCKYSKWCQNAFHGIPQPYTRNPWVATECKSSHSQHGEALAPTGASTCRPAIREGWGTQRDAQNSFQCIFFNARVSSQVSETACLPPPAELGART